MAVTLYLVSAKETAADRDKRLSAARARKDKAWNSLLFAPRLRVMPWSPEFKAFVDSKHKIISAADAELANHSRLQYWKVGVTKWSDPLRRDAARYQEVFRAVPIESKGTEFEDSMLIDSWAGDIEVRIARAFQRVDCPVGREALTIDAPLDLVLALFDQFVEWHHARRLQYIDPRRSAEQLMADWDYMRQVMGDTPCSPGDYTTGRSHVVLRAMSPLWQRCDAMISAIKDGVAGVRSQVANVAELEPMWA